MVFEIPFSAGLGDEGRGWIKLTLYLVEERIAIWNREEEVQICRLEIAS